MKHLLKISILSIIVLQFTVGAALAQPPNPAKGLFNELIQIKYSSELYVSRQIKNDTVLAIYNILRWQVDGLVYQLSSEMITNNSPRKLRLLNAWCLQNDNNDQVIKAKYRSIKNHILQMQAIEKYYAENVEAALYAQNKNINLTTNIFYLIKDSYGVVKGLTDLKTEKTMALVEQLDHVRMLSVGELGKREK